MKEFLITIERNKGATSNTLRLLKNQGFDPKVFYGLDAKVTGLSYTDWTYDLDHPGTDYHIGGLSIGNVLSHLLLWKALLLNDDDEDTSYLILEDDVRMREGAKERIDKAMKDLPDNWDMLYVGSCSTTKESEHDYGGGLFRLSRAFCTHAYVVRRRALELLAARCEKIWAPIDIAIHVGCANDFNTYGLIPRLADQYNTEISD